jgi:predicted DNA-binding ribbon-helix-helix protein
MARINNRRRFTYRDPIHRRRSSTSVERVFWEHLVTMAKERRITVGLLIAEIITENEGRANISSALRVAVVADLILKLEATQGGDQ